MQTILGAGGAIGVELAKALPQYTNEIRLVSRHPEKVNAGDELMPADLLDPAAVDRAVRGSEVVYVTVGFPYNLKVWQRSWPPFVQSVIDACQRHDAKLVFFDNIYMYDAAHLGHMTEGTPINPPSKKGQVRAKLTRSIMEAIESGRLTALIARAADFYGPNTGMRSVLPETVFKPLSTGGTANWLADDTKVHSFTFTPDAGKAVALLGNTADAFNQVWHLPTMSEPMTGKQWVAKVAHEFGAKPKHRVVPKWMVRLVGLFNPVMREMPEMMYQYDRDYVFSSEKFEKRFGVTPTSYEEGIREMIRQDYSRAKKD